MKKSKFGFVSWFMMLLWLFLGCLALQAANWYLENFDAFLGFNALLFTVLAGVDDVNSSLTSNFFLDVAIAAVCTVVLVAPLLLYRGKMKLWMKSKKTGKRITLLPLPRRLQGILVFLLGAGMIFSASKKVGLADWLVALPKATDIFETEYISPRDVSISFPEKKRNLVYIILESMETSFFSEQQGGSHPECILPGLYQLAQENINFSHNDAVGGLTEITGVEWTAASVLAQASGLPMLTPLDCNDSGLMKKVYPGAVTIWELLRENGYYQVMVMGSTKEYSGMGKMMYQHGMDEVRDYTAGVEDGIVPPDYFKAWGFEDLYTFRYAKETITRLAQMDQPFSVSMMSIDTHAMDGDVCELCGDEYKEQYDNVYACADRQVLEFISWLKEQPFYENTTVVICGDHLSMDGNYMDRNAIPISSRYIYDCILNSAAEPVNSKSRICSVMDMMPTTLAALGCTIEGERLGLGTNLFSDKPTVPEEMGVAQLNQEFANGTLPYFRKFILEE